MKLKNPFKSLPAPLVVSLFVLSFATSAMALAAKPVEGGSTYRAQCEAQYPVGGTYDPPRDYWVDVCIVDKCLKLHTDENGHTDSYLYRACLMNANVRQRAKPQPPRPTVDAGRPERWETPE